MDGLIFVGYQLSWFSWRGPSTNFSANEIAIFCMNIKENTMTTNFEPHECSIFLQSTKIGTQENKAIHSIRKQKDKNIGVQCKRRLEFLKVVDVIQDFLFIFLYAKSGLFCAKASNFNLLKPNLLTLYSLPNPIKI